MIKLKELITEDAIKNSEGVVFSKKGIKSNRPNWYIRRFVNKNAASGFAKILEKMIKAMDKLDIELDYKPGSKFYDDITVMSGKDFKKKYPGKDKEIKQKSKHSGGNTYLQNPWMVIWDHFQDNKELHKYF